ncbi:hypothetical protein BpHYR1_005761 [Brachionus plicatilis]|uniref:Uncharacterized protein n=1 Tax=Brachionus plicatilis TaxID=10195 RepID=A0A3M7R6Y5_BRAPC|nr:hypothetical protein BpHYR1_005761 [Brachionus plicatilis]
MIDSIKEDGDSDLKNAYDSSEKKKEHTNFTALVVDTRTKKVIRRINFNIAIEIPINTKIFYSKQNKNDHEINKDTTDLAKPNKYPDLGRMGIYFNFFFSRRKYSHISIYNIAIKKNSY